MLIGTSIDSVKKNHQMRILRNARATGTEVVHIDQPNTQEALRVEVDGVWYRVGVEGIDSHEDPEVIWP